MPGQRVTVAGRVTPAVDGQFVLVRISSPHRKSTFVRTRVRRGGFTIHFRTRRAVTYSVYARHDATPEQALFAARASAAAVKPGSGMAVALLKQGMRALGYQAGRGPAVTGKLGRELLAFRKVNGMARVPAAGNQIYKMVFAGRGAFKLRYPKAGKHVEFDWSRQVLVLADGGVPVRIYHASSGKPSTPTVFGTFHFYRKQPGTNSHGMVDSSYFIRGYAIHGYASVPTYAASHGCIRVPIPVAASIYNWINLGDTIYVYR